MYHSTAQKMAGKKCKNKIVWCVSFIILHENNISSHLCCCFLLMCWEIQPFQDNRTMIIHFIGVCVLMFYVMIKGLCTTLWEVFSESGFNIWIKRTIPSLPFLETISNLVLLERRRHIKICGGGGIVWLWCAQNVHIPGGQAILSFATCCYSLLWHGSFPPVCCWTLLGMHFIRVLISSLDLWK